MFKRIRYFSLLMVKLELFVSTNCPHCPKAYMAVKRATQGLDIEFEKIRINKKSGQKRAEKYNIVAVPCLVIDGKIMKGQIEENKVRSAIERKENPNSSFVSKIINWFK